MPSILPRFDFRAEFGVATDTGSKRRTNEDAYLISPEHAVFAVADGMGGHRAGEVAARLACEEIAAALSTQTAVRAVERYVSNAGLESRRKVLAFLRRAVEQANARIRREALENPDYSGMGTTLDVVWLARDHAFIAHAGDGRVYLARARAVLQLTHDHTLAARQSRAPDGLAITVAEAPTGSGVTNALGLSDSVQVDTLFVDLGPRDRLMLCTDGVHGQLEGEQEISELIRTGTPEAAARALIQRAGESGRDNATALVVEIADRFVKRPDRDRGLSPADLESARQSPLLVDLPLPLALTALSAAVEIEVAQGATVPRTVANDLVAYIVLEGLVKHTDGRSVGPGALLYPESLVGVWGQAAPPEATQTSRLLRVRADDFAEICSEPRYAAELYRRLAAHLARLAVKGGASGKTPGSGKPPGPGELPRPPGV
ncbi:MAG TPA: protein phosphatase 2C domain-containing protein [Polyangiaceae bacterium]|nr:protein phosphatase 2C domain-containing protein [Polyangiaceae bacterium]